MGSGQLPTRSWISRPPSAFDIVTCYLPNDDGSELKLRPAVVLKILKAKSSGTIACEIAYGTSNLKLAQRSHRDFFVQNSADLDSFNLPMATRFDLDRENRVILPWTAEFFGCWRGYDHPRLSSLTVDYVRELAWLLARQTMPPE